MYHGESDLLLSDLKEELESVKHYTEMIADVDGHMEKELLRAVARDEFHHAEFMMELMKDSHIDIPEEHRVLYDSVKDMVSFR